MAALIDYLKNDFDFIIVDSPAGVEKGDGKRDLEKVEERVQQPVARRFAGTDKVL